METRALNQAVKRNAERFPADFMFQLTGEEVELLVSQNMIPHHGRIGGASRALPGTRALTGKSSSLKNTPLDVPPRMWVAGMRSWDTNVVMAMASVFPSPLVGEGV